MSAYDVTKSKLLAAIQYSKNPHEIISMVNQALNEFGTLDFKIYLNLYSRIPNILTSFTTPLIAAVLRGDPDLVQFLLEKGANPNYTPAAVIGSPVDYALYTGNDLIADILVEAGGRPARPLTNDPREIRFRKNFIEYRPGGIGYQQVRTRFERGSEYYRNI